MVGMTGGNQRGTVATQYNNICIDCGEPCERRAVRCARCNSIFSGTFGGRECQYMPSPEQIRASAAEVRERHYQACGIGTDGLAWDE